MVLSRARKIFKMPWEKPEKVRPNKAKNTMEKSENSAPSKPPKISKSIPHFQP